MPRVTPSTPSLSTPSLPAPSLARAARSVRAHVRESLVHLKHELDWNLVYNPPARRHLRASPAPLTPEQRLRVGELADTGIAFTSVDALGVDPELWRGLGAVVDRFCESERVRADIAAYASAIDRSTRRGGDDYMIKLHEEGPTLALDDPLLRLGLTPPLLDTVNAYLELWSKLIYTDVWHTIPFRTDRRIGSQSWHRDPEDQRMVKVYLYFRDADEGSGPLEYVRGSVGHGRYARLWPWRPLAGAARYPPTEELDRVVPEAARVRCVGRRGTIVFCDTSGLHRGGISTTSPRVVATWTYVTPAALALTARRRFRTAPAADGWSPAGAVAFALN